MKKLAFFATILLLLSGCCSHLVTIREPHVPSYDVGKAIEKAIRKVENTGNFVSDIVIERNSSYRISKNACDSNGRPIIFMDTYDITVYGDVWEKRLVYFYYRTARNYDEVKDKLNERLKNSDVWVDN